MFLGLALLLVPLCAAALRTWVLPAVMRPRRTLIVGAGAVGQLVERKIAVAPRVRPRARRLRRRRRARPATRPILGPPADLPRLVDSSRSTGWSSRSRRRPTSETLDLVRAVRRPDVHLSIVPRYFELFASNATIEDLEGMPVVSLPPMRLSRSVRVLKRAVDVVVVSRSACSCCRRCSRVVALADQARQPRPRLLPPGAPRPRRERVPDRQVPHDGGRRRGAALRARRPQRDGAAARCSRSRTDPRVTRVGRAAAQAEHRRAAAALERAARRDEPRRPAPVRRPRVRARSPAGPAAGWISRPASPASGRSSGRNDMPFDEMVKLDYIYVTNWSLWWDIKILCQTIPVVLARTGGVLMHVFVVPAFNEEAEPPAPARRSRVAPGAVARAGASSSSTTARATAPPRLRARTRARCRSR